MYLFGITGGLLPCAAAITVLLICLQLKETPLGAVMVLCFSIGLAITLVTVGGIAAIGSRHATKRFPWLSAMAARAPYLSGALIISSVSMSATTAFWVLPLATHEQTKRGSKFYFTNPNKNGYSPLQCIVDEQQ